MKELISIFKSAKSVEPVDVELRVFLSSTRHKDEVLAVRNETDKSRRDNLKKSLPGATISGRFTRRSVEGLTQYNGLVCLDFDEKDNPGRSAEEMRAMLATFEEVYYAGISVGGKGTFAIIRTNNADPKLHGALVDLLGAVMSQFDLYYDAACKDVSRLRFVSYDPDAHWNTNPAIFDASRLLTIQQPVTADEDPARKPRPLIVRQAPTNKYQESRTSDRVEQLITQIEQTRTDLTDDYDQWLRLGLALASEFGAFGSGYYLRLSQFHPKFSQQETEKKYAEYCRNGRRVKIGTFFKILSDNGIK